MIRAALITTIALAAPNAAGAFLLSVPLDCDLGDDCYIQQYVDRDPGAGAADFTCGPLANDGHKGTDFAVPSLSAMAAGVNVLAAAPGTVTGVRDGMADIPVTADNAPDIDGRECGNGVVIRHGDGWETQYCHLKQGSIAVQSGQRVGKGTVLGQVGLSGETSYPHVHLSLRKDGAVIDPFDPSGAPATCDTPDTALWEDPIAYRGGGLIAIGVDTAVPEYGAVKRGPPPIDRLTPDIPALVVWGYAYGGRAGDILRIDIAGPDGFAFTHDAELDRTQPQLYRAAGTRNQGKRWPIGTYTGTVQMLRNGVEVDQRSVTFDITP